MKKMDLTMKPLKKPDRIAAFGRKEGDEGIPVGAVRRTRGGCSNGQKLRKSFLLTGKGKKNRLE